MGAGTVMTLVAERDARLQFELRQILLHERFQVRETGESSQALQFVKGNRVELVIMGAAGNGLDLVDKIRKRDRRLAIAMSVKAVVKSG